ncbi:MAG: hypothetical protein IPG25_08295 [Proteobacteria bacterium]|nr:hypothetical protein [Pseudomonadota bacterium]
MPRLPWVVGALAPVISSPIVQFHDYGCQRAVQATWRKAR